MRQPPPRSVMEKISVAVCFCPPNPAATEPSPSGASGGGGGDTCVSLLHRAAGPVPGASFAFVCSADHEFDGEATNERIYGALDQELIGAIVGGFIGITFAYGQTNSGKTSTMNGSDADPDIIPGAVRDVLDTVCLSDDREFLVQVSYMETYNEEITHLLTL